jgi:hypothetical protein
MTGLRFVTTSLEWTSAVRAALDAGHEVRAEPDPIDPLDFALVWEGGRVQVSVA